MTEKNDNSGHIAPLGDTSDGGAYREVIAMARDVAAGVRGCVKAASLVPPHPVIKGVACVGGG